MPRKKLPYRPGDLFAVPLACGGFAIGLAARMDGRGTVLGYFFGPRHGEPPATGDIGELRRADALKVMKFGDLGLIEGRWHVFGQLPGWTPEDWPVPTFGRIDVVSGKRAWRVRYRDQDLAWLSDEEIVVSEARVLPEDGLMGAVAVERWLARRLDPHESPASDVRLTTLTRA